MRWLAVLCMLLIGQQSLLAAEVEMKIGTNAFAFDLKVDGDTIAVHEIGEAETDENLIESIAHNWFAIEDIVKAVPNAFKKPALGLQVGRTGDIGANAFAAIFRGKRYVVIGHEIHQDYAKMMFVMAHELGHHVCGHTAVTHTDNAWRDELEADRFAGLAIRENEKQGGGWGLTLDDTLRYARELLASGGPGTSHPPLSDRINAILDGYRNGSSCVGRDVPEIPASMLGGLAQSTRSIWQHNGSTMGLVANGSYREFRYEVPRKGLVDAGVKSGTLLFKGSKTGNTYSGTAYVFTPCGALPYAVAGPVSEDQRQVTMKGHMPIPTSNCSISRYQEDTLVFRLSGR